MSARNLYRSRNNRVIAGVCGGLGTHMGIDPLILRILFILVPSGLLIYIILWIALPEMDEYEVEEMPSSGDTFLSGMDENAKNGALWGGVLLIAIGVLFLIDKLIPAIRFSDIWPVILIAVGVIMVYNAYQDNDENSNHKQSF